MLLQDKLTGLYVEASVSQVTTVFKITVEKMWPLYPLIQLVTILYSLN